MHGHDGDLLAVARPLIVHHQADMLEKIGERVVFLHRAREFDEVVGAAGALSTSVLGQHVVVAAFA